MFKTTIVVGVLALVCSAGAFAVEATGNVEVTVKGVMQEDKAGMFIVADGQYYDLAFSDDSSADMKKFRSSLNGDMVRVKGNLLVEKSKEGKTRLIVQANEVARLRGERAPEVRYETRVIEDHPVYVEHEHGIHLPGVHINW